jgi:hypothetical protein
MNVFDLGVSELNPYANEFIPMSKRNLINNKKRHIIHKFGLNDEKSISEEDKNGIHFSVCNISLKKTQQNELIHQTNLIFLSPKKNELLNKLKNDYYALLKKFENNINTFNNYFYCYNGILFSYCIYKKYGLFDLWNNNLELHKKNTFILSVYEIVE